MPVFPTCNTERFNVIAKTNENKDEYYNEPMRTQSKYT